MGKANFTEDFKRDAVLQITEWGYPVSEVAARLGISKYSLYDWKKRYAKPATARDDDQAAESAGGSACCSGPPSSATSQKKSGRVLRQGCKVTGRAARSSELRVHRAASPAVSIRAMCRCLSVEPSGFYAWLKEPLRRRARDDRRQTELIRSAWSDNSKVYGYWKLHDLMDIGESCCRTRPDIARQRERWQRHQARIDPKRLVFIDETWIKTNMAPLHCWGLEGSGFGSACRMAMCGRPPRAPRTRSSSPQECCIKSGALYVYHRAALASLLQARADAVTAARFSLDPDRFVAHIAAVWVDVDHPAHILIRAAFADSP